MTPWTLLGWAAAIGAALVIAAVVAYAVTSTWTAARLDIAKRRAEIVKLRQGGGPR